MKWKLFQDLKGLINTENKKSSTTESTQLSPHFKIEMHQNNFPAARHDTVKTKSKAGLHLRVNTSEMGHLSSVLVLSLTVVFCFDSAGETHNIRMSVGPPVCMIPASVHAFLCEMNVCHSLVCVCNFFVD